MDTIGDLANSMGITVEKLREETEPDMMVCVHHDSCSQFNCEHKMPHHSHNEIGTCDSEVCMREGVVAHCHAITD